MILPDFLHKHIVYPLWTVKDRNYPFSWLKDFQLSQYRDSAAQDQLRWERMKNILAHAFNTCDYYKTTWSELGLHPTDIKSWEDMEKIPILEKKDIQNNLDGLISSKFQKNQLVRNQTGGSTGQPLVFYHDHDRLASRLASTIRHDRWAEKDYSTVYACLWGHPSESQNSLKNFWELWKEKNIGRTFFLDTSSLSLEKFAAFNLELKKIKPRVYLSYANSIFLFSRFIEDAGITDYHRPQSIITSAELLTDDMRETIERVFGCKVFNRYGCREVSVIASECEAHEGMHINTDALHVEITRKGRAVSAGEEGEIVLTDMLNFGMPLIRYRIKDVGNIKSTACSCGRSLPLLELKGGRVTDFISTADGKIVSGASLTIYLVANAPGVAQAQLYQADIHNVEARILKGDDYSEASTEYLMNTIRHFLGDSINISIKFLDELIPVSASGKYRFSISEVDPFQS